MNLQSYYPNTINRELLRMIHKRILELSCSKKNLKATRIYKQSLNGSNLRVTVNFKEQKSKRNVRTKTLHGLIQHKMKLLRQNIDK